MHQEDYSLLAAHGIVLCPSLAGEIVFVGGAHVASWAGKKEKTTATLIKMHAGNNFSVILTPKEDIK
jgi:hypothetical protein